MWGTGCSTLWQPHLPVDETKRVNVLPRITLKMAIEMVCGVIVFCFLVFFYFIITFCCILASVFIFVDKNIGTVNYGYTTY